MLEIDHQYMRFSGQNIRKRLPKSESSGGKKDVRSAVNKHTPFLVLLSLVRDHEYGSQ